MAREIPLVGFYLQPAVGGIVLPVSFWRRFAAIENVVAIKIAPFNRYRTLDVVRGVVEAGAEDRVTLYTGNDDHIVLDLVTPFSVTVARQADDRAHQGRPARALERVDEERGRAAGAHPRAASTGPIPADLLALDSRGHRLQRARSSTSRNDFHGCISGCHEVLRRQGLLEGIWCLDPNETLGARPDCRRSTASARPIRT